MSTFVKIKALRQSLSSSEAKLADFTLNRPMRFVIYPLLNYKKWLVLANQVVKFSQKLGYKGFLLLLAVIDALNDESSEPKLHGKITLNDSLEQIAEKLLSSKLAVLTETKTLTKRLQSKKRLNY